jgi:hypothetical protein
MTRNILLSGTAALLSLSCGATMSSAADMPLVKVPVQYVKACNKLDGEGFFTIPGTDSCIKIGGYIRLQAVTGGSGDGTVTGADNMAPQGVKTRTNTSTLNYDARAVMSVDVRVPTTLGQVRGYARFGAEQDTPIGSGYMSVLPQATSNTPFLMWDRGYVQFFGFTVGKARSFFDIWAASDGSLTYGNLRTTGDTDLTGVVLAAYTYAWGNGFSASVSAENPNDHFKVGVADLGLAGQMGLGTFATDNAFTTGTNQGIGLPDFVGNVRTDQSWGYAGVSGALHQVAAGYYSAVAPGAAAPGCTAGTLCSGFGSPTNQLGWAASGGADVFVPTGKEDTLGFDIVYADGAIDYAAKGNRWQLYNSGNNAGFAWGFDGVFDNIGGGIAPFQASGSIDLTKAWSFNAGYEHHWTDQWKTSAYGGFAVIRYDMTATDIINSHLPGAGGVAICPPVPVAGAVQPPLGISTGGAGNACSPNYSFWQLGSRTQYSPTAWLDVGVDATYTRFNTAYKGPTVALAANGAQPSGTYTIDNQNVWTVMGRVQLNFLPGK